MKMGKENIFNAACPAPSVYMASCCNQTSMEASKLWIVCDIICKYDIWQLKKHKHEGIKNVVHHEASKLCILLFFFPLCTMSITRFHTNYFINHKSNVISPLCHLILFLNNLITIWRNNFAPHTLCIMLHARWTPAILQYCTTNTSTPGVAKRRHRLLQCLEHILLTREHD